MGTVMAATGGLAVLCVVARIIDMVRAPYWRAIAVERRERWEMRRMGRRRAAGRAAGGAA